MRLTPGTLSAESRAMVTSTSGETVVFPCEYGSVIVSPYRGGLDTPANAATRPARALHHRHPTVHAEDLAGNERGLVRSEESDGVGNFFRRSLARQGDHFQKRGQGFWIHQFKDFSINESGSNGIDRDITRSDFSCKRLGKSDLPAFGSRVIRLPGVAHVSRHRGHIYDASLAFAHHVLDGSFRAVEGG